MNIWNLFLTATESTLATEVTEAMEAALQFKPLAFVENLKYMGVGMLTIFLVIGVIILATVLINKLSSKK